MKLEGYKTGTTTVGIVAKDGIVIAADMQATLGNLKSNNDMTKVYKINDHLAVTIAGSVGDLLVLVRFLKVQANLYEMEHKRPMSTKACATLLSNILNSSKMMPYFSQFLIAGSIGGLSLYSVDVLGGLIEEREFSVSGSGSELALSSLDKGYKDGITTVDAVNLAKEAISSARKRDIFTGGKGIHMMVIKDGGIEDHPFVSYE